MKIFYETNLTNQGTHCPVTNRKKGFPKVSVNKQNVGLILYPFSFQGRMLVKEGIGIGC
jgi:hypothetical protein